MSSTLRKSEESSAKSLILDAILSVKSFKFIDLKQIISKSLPDIIILAETKIDSSFSKPQFYLENYYEPTRDDKSTNSGDIIEYIRKGVVRKRIPELELKSFERITSELTIAKNNWFLLSFYRTEREENKLSNITKFFQELFQILNKAINKYDNIIIMGDINIDHGNKKSIGYKELVNFMDIFSLKNLINDKTCFFRGHESSIDVILTNQPRKFYTSKTFELGVSDCHKMIATSLRAHIPRIKSKTVYYRSYKNFDRITFLKELADNISDNFDVSDANSSYENFVNILLNVTDKRESKSFHEQRDE